MSTTQHNMLREIYEQPDAVRRTVESLKAELEFGPAQSLLRSASRIVIAASGTSRHAGLAGKAIFESLANVPTSVEFSSEFQYSRAAMDQVLTIIVTQSGETADTLAAMRRAKTNGSKVLAISNVADSSVMREADAAVHTKAGVELAIPSTKAFAAQLATFYMLGISLALEKRKIDSAQAKTRAAAALAVPEKIKCALDLDAQCRELAQHFASCSDFIFAGRGVHLAAAMDGALKLKEVAYLHAEGLPVGEIPHGPLALMDENFTVFGLATYDPSDTDSVTRHRSALATLSQIHQRRAKLITVANEGDQEPASLSDYVLQVPPADEFLLPILEMVPLQLFAYHCAVHKGLDVDRPRNLTKAVLTP